jgi:Clp amino terminal domain, pathogenicity island component
MAHRLVKVTAATATATALVAGGYAIGTRSDGSAQAGARPGVRAAGPYGWHRMGPRRAFMLSTLASRLGVTESALRAALQDLRPQRRAERRAHRDEHVAELAKALGISESKVRAALVKVRAQQPRVWPGTPMRGRHAPRAHMPGARIDALARALGMKPADVRAAIEKIGRTMFQDRQQRIDDFATALAGKLGIDPAKAKQALESFLGPARFREHRAWGAPPPGAPAPAPTP